MGEEFKEEADSLMTLISIVFRLRWRSFLLLFYPSEGKGTIAEVISVQLTNSCSSPNWVPLEEADGIANLWTGESPRKGTHTGCGHELVGAGRVVRHEGDMRFLSSTSSLF
jgi:hypothetical protein